MAKHYLSITKNVYKKNKQSSINKKENKWVYIQSLEEESQPFAIFELWPQKVPKILWKRCSTKQKKLWHIQRIQMLERKIFDSCPELSNLLINLRLQKNFVKAIEKYGDIFNDIFKIIIKIPNKKNIVVNFSDIPDEDDLIQDDLELSVEVVIDKDNKISEEDMGKILESVCMGLEKEGEIIIYQELPLKIQRKNKNGEMEWINQEKVFGVRLQNSSWTGLNKNEVRNTLTVNKENGDTIPIPLGLFCGDMEDFIKNISKY